MPNDVLILGGGFGGLTAARRLERKLAPQAAKVTLVNDVNFLLYTPLLPGAAAGTLEPRHVVVPLRDHLRRTVLHLGMVLGPIPTAAPCRALARRARAGAALRPADRHAGLDVAHAADPGSREHALGFKTLSEAIALRNRVVQTLEQAEIERDEDASSALLMYVFVGGGYAGLEGLAELQDAAESSCATRARVCSACASCWSKRRTG